MKVYLAQIAPSLSRENVELHINIIKENGKNNDVVIFPELSLNGYMMMDAVYEDAFDISELNVFCDLSKDVDILLGCALKENGSIYNTAIYFSKGKVLHIHRKNNLPNYGMFEEARYFFSGEEVEKFSTEFGEAIVVVCEDLWSSKVVNKITKQSPDVIYVIASSPTRSFGEDGLLIEDQWNSLLKSSALLSGAHVVFVNRVGYEDGMGFWGGSKVITPNSIIQEESKLFEEDSIEVKINKKLSNTSKYMIRHG